VLLALAAATTTARLPAVNGASLFEASKLAAFSAAASPPPTTAVRPKRPLKDERACETDTLPASENAAVSITVSPKIPRKYLPFRFSMFFIRNTPLGAFAGQTCRLRQANNSVSVSIRLKQ
jgi:hypothetical protein